MNFNMSLLIGLVVMALISCTPHRQVVLNRMNQRFDNPGKVEKILKGVDWYNFLGKDVTLQRNMSINILEIDLDKAAVDIDFAWFNDQRSTLSDVADSALAIAAINSAYFEKLNDGGYVSFHKSNGIVNQRVEVPLSHTRFWKHQAAIVETAHNQFAFIAGDQRLYDSLKYDNIVSSAPLLISDGVPVGKYFVSRKEGDKSDLESEHPDRHQASFGPRTAFAKTANNHLILITVDGRSPRAQGINAEELTDLLLNWLDATDAINMDGGGSVTMFVRGATPTGVVNYPSDQRKADINNFFHAGQRRNGMALLIRPTKPDDIRRMQLTKVAPDTAAMEYRDPNNFPLRNQN